MMKVAIVLLSVLALAAAMPKLTDQDYEALFSKWTMQHNKRYSTPDERTQRLAVFRSNLDYILANQANPDRTVELKMNAFGDLTNEEFVASHNGYRHVEMSHYRKLNVENLEVPDSILAADVDWRNVNGKSYVTPIKDQGQCGSCWAFSAIGAIESGYAVDQKVAATVQGSEQELVDCATAQGNMGCQGGLMDYAFEFVEQNKGVTSETSYPYKARDGTCASKGKTNVLAITSFKDVTANNATALAAAVATRPVSVAVDAAGSDWQFYSGGVISSSSCGTSLDHGVLVVGHITSQNPAYWIVKNSWGTSWGNKGYVYIADTKGNNAGICGINMAPSYPTGVKAIARRH